MKKILAGYQAQALAWWRKREAREQKLLLIMAVVFVIFIIWYGIWQPLNSSIDRAQSRLNTQQETLRYVIENTQRVEQLRNQRPQQATNPVSSEELNSFISRTSRSHDLEVSRLQPQNESLLIVFNEADFNSLLAFLAELGSRQVQVQVIDIAESNEPGMVRVRRLQVRAGA